MTFLYKSMLLLLIFTLPGCASVSRTLISLDGSQTTDLSQVSLIIEDQDNPALLRGVDGVPIKTMRVPSVFGNYAYVIRPGSHVLWLKGSPYPHPLLPQHIRCYTMHVVLQQGVRYILVEEIRNKKAKLVRENTRETISYGALVDEPLVFKRECKW